MTDQTNLSSTQPLQSNPLNNPSDHPTLKNIAVIGAGYVGLSNAILLAQAHINTQVTLFDIDPNKIELLKQNQSPLQDTEILDYLANKPLNLSATLQSVIDNQGIYQNSD